MRVVSIEIIPIRLPLVRTLHTANGELGAREGTLVRFEAESGATGWGEASPYPGFGAETVAGAREALTNWAPMLLGRSVDELEGELTRLESTPCVRAAFETSRLDLAARAQGVALCDVIVPGSRARVERIPCNALLAEASTAALVKTACRYRECGYRTMKLKVGANDLARDRERIAAVREALGSDVKLRLDANQAYDIERAKAAVAAFAPFEIEYLEQPLIASDLEGLAQLRREIQLPIAIDEGALDIVQLRRAIELEAADVVVIKPSSAGGPVAALAMARVARAAGLDVVVTTLLDSAVGVAAAIHAAAAIAAEGEVRACGLATADHFALDVAELAAPKDGAIDVPSCPGLGIEVDRDTAERWLAGKPIRFQA